MTCKDTNEKFSRGSMHVAAAYYARKAQRTELLKYD